ncbi:hypothetical protein IWX90DRAFT_233422 [Phyllosticta citrichinensis]|uniref:Secreted protein n=1 Tax=Phyllosticta citrichinensis TaxID=1130410 RepID=A0ABR1XUT2_9PEZI
MYGRSRCTAWPLGLAFLLPLLRFRLVCPEHGVYGCRFFGSGTRIQIRLLRCRGLANTRYLRWWAGNAGYYCCVSHQEHPLASTPRFRMQSGSSHSLTRQHKGSIHPHQVICQVFENQKMWFCFSMDGKLSFVTFSFGFCPTRYSDGRARLSGTWKRSPVVCRRSAEGRKVTR